MQNAELKKMQGIEGMEGMQARVILKAQLEESP
jgi:hypothetical protein